MASYGKCEFFQKIYGVLFQKLNGLFAAPPVKHTDSRKGPPTRQPPRVHKAIVDSLPVRVIKAFICHAFLLSTTGTRPLD